MFAKLSPDGTKAAYSSEHNLYVEDLASGVITPLTSDGAFRMINGTFDWAYEEEFSCRDGFRWSPDSKSIAYWQIDATGDRNFLMIDNTDSLYSFTIPVEYPKAGEDPSACRVGVVDLATGRPSGCRCRETAGSIIFRGWNGRTTAANWCWSSSTASRMTQRSLFAMRRPGSATPVYEETDSAWIDVKLGGAMIRRAGNG